MEAIDDSTKEVAPLSRRLTSALKTLNVPEEVGDIDARMHAGRFDLASYLVWLRREMELHVLLHETLSNSEDDRLHRIWANDLAPMMRLENDFRYFGLSLDYRLHRPLMPDLVRGLSLDSPYAVGALYGLERRHRDINKYVHELQNRFRVPSEALTYPVGSGARTAERFGRFKRRLNSEPFTDAEFAEIKDGALDVTKDHYIFLASMFR